MNQVNFQDGPLAELGELLYDGSSDAKIYSVRSETCHAQATANIICESQTA